MSRSGGQVWTGALVLGAAGALMCGLWAYAAEPPARKGGGKAAAKASASASARAAASTVASAEPPPRQLPATGDGEGRRAGLNPAAGKRGWELFLSKGCIRCHSVYGHGGTIGPDIGRSTVGRLSEGQLMAEMWNSVPRMWAKMEEERLHFESVSREEMADLFAFFFYLRYMDEPGDARQGELAMLRHRCQACHQVSGQGGAVGPDLAEWARYANPVVWSQKMWSGAPGMQAKMQEKEMTWPKFAPGDMSNMIAYVRSVSPSGEKVYLALGNPAEGASLMAAKKCLVCHTEGGSAPAVADLDIPDNMAEAAGAMLSHAPEMLKEMRALDLEPAAVEPQELAHILTYLLSLRFLDRPGNAQKGWGLFRDRGCVDCHEKGTSAAPELAKMHPEGTVSYMSHVMWNKGPKMIKEMVAVGAPWPTFTRAEMLDLLAFLQQRPRAK